MTFKEFRAKYNQEYVEVAGSPGAENQCVDLANAYLKEVLNHPIVEWTNARDFPSKLPDFEWIENTIDAIPQEGDLMIWQHNQWGHISILIDADEMNFTSFDQNYPTGTPAHIQYHNYLNPKVAGWLRPPGSEEMNDDMMEIKKSEFERLITEANAKDETIKNLEYEVEKKKKVVADMSSDISELNQQIEDHQCVEMETEFEATGKIVTEKLSDNKTVSTSYKVK